MDPSIPEHSLQSVTGETHVFSSSGVNVTLACINARHDCTSTTWNYNKHSSSVGVELINGGKKKNDTERAERLSLGSDCSLNIYKTTKDDHGQYNCQQYVNDYKHGSDALVLLHVLHVSSSSTQTEMRSGSSVTLTCQLFTVDNTCDSLSRTEDLQLFWVNQAGANLQTDSRYQILLSGPCIKTLTTTLLNEDDNTELRCLAKMKNEIKTSARYTVKFKASTKPTIKPTSKITSSPTTSLSPKQASTKPIIKPTSKITSSPTAALSSKQASATATTRIIPTSKKTSSPTASLPPKQDDGDKNDNNRSNVTVTVIIAVIAVVVFLFAVILLVVIWKKRANRRQADNPVVADTDDNNRTNETINISTIDQKDDVTYSEVITSSKTQIIKNNVLSDDNVTYAALRGGEVEVQDNSSMLYASVNKTPRK
nr:location of vulva defective 1-like [Misgurnus anguillicaudatus]